MANFWEGLLGGAAPLAGGYQQYKNIGDAKGEVGNFFGDLQQGVSDRTQFKPWSMYSGLGSNTSDAEGNMRNQLSNRLAGMQNDQWAGGNQMMMDSMQGMPARQNQLYEAMRAGQMPGEQRAQNQMNQQMMNQGRMGMGSNSYGGSPEQFAFEKARAEADNSAWMGAQNMAQNEQLQQFNIGQGMFNSGFTPQQMLMQQAGLGQNNAQLMQNANLNDASLFAQLGLGEQTARNNYTNMENDILGKMWSTLGNMGQGAGQYMDQNGGAGGLWDSFKSIFQNDNSGGGGLGGIFDGTSGINW